MEPDGDAPNEFDLEDYSEGQSDESDPLVSSDSESDRLNREAREEVFGADIDTLIAETRNRRRKGRRRRPLGQPGVKRRKQWDVPPHLSSVIGAATSEYVAQRHDTAIALLTRVVEEAPKAATPYRMLGLIYEERGNRRKALDAYMSAASLDKRELDLWKRNALLWEEEGDIDQAIQCLSRAIKASAGQDLESLGARGEYRIKQGQLRKAADNYAKIHAILPHDLEVIKKLVDLYKQCKLLNKAVAILESSIEYFQQGFTRRDGITTTARRNLIIMELVQLLVEIWFKQKKYSESSALLTRVKERFSSTGSPMTFEQRLLLAICQHRLGAETLASPTFIEFMSSPSMMDKHQSLLWEVADACLDSGDYRKATKAYDLLEGTGLYAADLRLFLRRATCHKELNSIEKCKSDLLTVLRIKPRHMEASMRLVEFYPEIAREKRNETNRKRRLRRKEKIPHSALPVQPNPDAPASERSNLPRVGYEYLTKGNDKLTATTTNECIYVPVSTEDVQQAMKLLTAAEVAFRSEDCDKFLRLIGPPIEAALNLPVKLHINEAEEQGEDEDENAEDNGVTNTFASTPNESLTDEVTVSKHNDVEDRATTIPTRSVLASDIVAILENNPRLHEIGVALLRETSYESFAWCLERVFDSLYRLGRIDDIEPAMSALLSIAAVRIGPESPFKLRMQALLITSLFATGRYFDAFSKLRHMLITTIDDPRVCCLFAIAEEHMGVATEYERFKSFRVLDRLHKKRQDLPILTYVNGLCSARGLNNSHNYTLGKFLETYAIVSKSPLLCLCMVVQLVYVAQNRRVGNRNKIVLYAMSFLDEYRRKRRERSANKCTLVVELEVLYNTGRTMHQFGLYHMAIEMYKQVLELSDANQLPQWADLRREAAFNLVHIYNASNSTEMAREIMLEYLVF